MVEASLTYSIRSKKRSYLVYITIEVENKRANIN